MPKTMQKHFISFIILNLFIIKTDSTSAQIIPEWTDTNYTSLYPRHTYQYDMKTDLNGNVYTTGFTLDTASFPTTKIIKYNSSGIVQWEDLIDSSHYNNKIAVDTTGNVYVSGTRYSGTGWIAFT